MRLKIVHIEDHFDPTAGYQINELLMQNEFYNDNVYLITTTDMKPFHKKVSKEEDNRFQNKYKIKIIRKRKLMKISSRVLYWRLFSTIKRLNPDIVFLHGIADFKDLILFSRKKKYILYRDSHMSWVASNNKNAKLFYKVYKKIFAPKINNKNKYDMVFALGIEEKEYLLTLGIDESKIELLPHGYNKNTMYFSKKKKQK